MTIKTRLWVPKGAPSAYWEGWAEPVLYFGLVDPDRILLETIRSGDDGRSDAQYIVDRLASGLHFAEVVR